MADNIAATVLVAAVMIMPGCGGGGGASTIGRSAVTVAKEGRAESSRSYTIGPQFEGQLEQMISREVMALGGKENVPMELNRQVLLNINYFLNDARGFMTKGLSRGSKYIPMMKAIFRQKGLPEDLVYLALIESGFRTSAVSHAQAVGPWQFIAATGRRYGLTINEWVDERMDPVKSTYAAADYLTALHDMFNSWPLAIAAYNSGEGKILKGMQNYGVSNFWDMSSVGGHLANETKLYVPSFLAATFIAKDPAAYGLAIETLPPDQWEEVVVPTPINLKDAASFSGSSLERIQELNPHLKKSATPPNEADFVLRIPEGSGQQFAKAYGRSGKGQAVASLSKDSGVVAPSVEASPVGKTAPTKPTLATITHKVKEGDTLQIIAKRYGLSVDSIKQSNNIKSNTIQAGQILKIKSDLPLTATKQTEPSTLMVVETRNAPPKTMTIHTVASGENLGQIALKYNMSVRELVDINALESTTIKVGQKLTVSGPPATGGVKGSQSDKDGRGVAVHTVTSGENLGQIAKKYSLTSKELMTLNKLSGPNIRAGQKLKLSADEAPTKKMESVAEPSKSVSSEVRLHTVAPGENLGSIAQKYGLKTKELMALNNLEKSNIRIGQKLKVKGQPGGPSASGPVSKDMAQSADMAPKKATSGAREKDVVTSQPTATKPAAGVHVVSSGDNIGLIAKKYGLAPKDLMAMNNMTDPTIRVGQKLQVGGVVTTKSVSEPISKATYKVVDGDTLYSIARKNNLSVDELKKINKMDTNNLKLGQTLKLK